jgi:hypothetical protein
MQIPGPLIPPLPSALLSKAPDAVVDAFKQGQLVTATILTPQSGGQANISIQGALIQAQTTLPLSPGQQLQLEVTKVAQQALLRVVPQDPKQPSAQILLPASNPQLGQWKSGQIIQARVDPSPQQGQMALDLAGLKVVAKNQLPPPLAQPGQALKLEVVHPGAPAALKVLKIQAPAPNSPVLVHQAVRAELPKQMPLPPLLANLTAVTTPQTPVAKPTQNLPPLPQPVVDLARRIVAELPTRETIRSPEGLRQAIQQSGVFLEPLLARYVQQRQMGQTPTQPVPTPTGDTKAALLSLLASLFTLTKVQPKTASTPTGQTAQSATTPAAPHSQPSLPPLPHLPPQPQARAAATLTAHMTTQQALLELMRQTEGGLARIHLNQLASQPQEDDNRRIWVTELPVRQGEQQDVIQLRIEEETDGGDKKRPKQWSVTLAMDLDKLGPVRIRVSLLDGQVSASFWAEETRTTRLFQDHLQQLKEQLSQSGLKVGNLSANQGQGPTTSPPPSQSYVLLDEQA